MDIRIAHCSSGLAIIPKLPGSENSLMFLSPTIILLAMVVASGLHTARSAQAMVTIVRQKKQCKLCTSHGHNHKPQTKK